MKQVKTHLLILMVCIMQAFSSTAQVTIVINTPQSFQVKVSDMFNANIINVGSVPLKLYLVGTIVNAKTGQRVAEGKTQALDYSIGSKLVNETMLNPVYTYNSTAVQQTGLLPYGNYRICLNAYSAADNEGKGDECIDEEITPLSPPMLLSPENGSTILTNYPLLIWLPPTPVNQRMGVQYDLKLVELTGNQTPYDAIQRNFAILEQQNLSTTNLQYPANAMQLQEGKTYAWKILAKTNEGTMIGETEVWTFKYAPEKSSDEPVVERNYVKLKRELDNYYVVVQNQLKVIYEEPYMKTKVNCKIYDMNRNEKKSLELDVKEVGDNKLTIDIETIQSLKNKTFYILEVSAPRRPNQYLLFKIIK